MEKPDVPQAESPFLTSRFRQFFWGTQIAAIGGILNLIIFGEKLIDSERLLFVRLDLIAFVIGVIVTAFLFILLNKGKYLKAITAYLWLWSVIMAFTTWFEGGLYSPLLLSFPLIFIFAALFTEKTAFLSICGFLSVVILFMGFNHDYHWIMPPEGSSIIGFSRTLSALILNALAGYVCWVFGRILKKSFDDLKLENKRVVESQIANKKLADCDALTGLLNRHGAELGYQSLRKQLDVNRESILAYFIDLDDFKNINDFFDHQAGDRLLVTMSQRLSSLLHKDDDFVCRMGGDEFVLVVRADKNFHAEGFAEEILRCLAQPHSIFGTEAEITVSVGIAGLGCDLESSFNDLCKKADMAMYKAKLSGKNNYHLYSETLHREYMRSLNIINGLNSAISNELLDLHFQPKINLQDNNVEGVEALLRWNRGNIDNIRPDEFFPIIESTELIHTIGAWVISEACFACKKWHEEGSPLKVAVNVSALQLTRPNFSETIMDALEESGLPPEFLEIEITEHSLIKESPEVKIQLETLKLLGIGLAIDDFGTGYSNMSYLTRLKVDVLKLDRSFVSEIDQSKERRVIVKAIIKMAKILGMKVVAEGIETKDEQNILVGLDCDYGQGFLWSRAVPSIDLLRTIDSFQSRA